MSSSSAGRREPSLEPVLLRAATLELARRPGVGYLRIEKNVPFDSSATGGSFEIGRARVLRLGGDVTLIATGGIVVEAIRASDALARAGISAAVVSMHTLTPFDAEAVRRAALETRAIVTIEENNIVGGLGGAVAEVLAELGAGVRFARIGMPSIYSSIVGDQDYLRQRYSLDSPAIERTVLGLLDQPVRQMAFR